MQTLPLRTPGLDAALRRWGPSLQHAAPVVVRVLLVLWLAWLLASLTWSFLPQGASAPVAQAPVTSAAARRVDAGRIANQHLFGQYAPQAPVSSDAPDTTLALTLHGIVAGKRVQDSRALIVVNGDEQPYAVGAQLPGGALIRAIYPDRVMLERDGRVEALRLPKADLGQSTQAPARFSAAPTAGLGQAPPQDLGQLRQQIVSNPQRLMDVVRAMPVMQGGKLSGYRVYPAGNSPAFAQLGLRPGDIVTGVNGIPLTDPAQSMRVLSALKTSDQISISMLRNGQPQTQVVQIPPAGAAPAPVQQDDESQDQPDDDQGDNPPR